MNEPALGNLSEPAPRDERARLHRAALREMVLPALAVLAAMHLLPLIPALSLPTDLARLAVPAVAAAVVIAGFLIRPPAALLAFAVFVLFYETTQRWIGEPIKQVDEMAIPLLGLIALLRYRPGRRRLLSPLREGAVALLVIAALLSTFQQAVPLNVWAPGLVLLLKGLTLFYVAAWLPLGEQHIRGAVYLLLGTALIVAVGALLEVFAPGWLLAIGLSVGQARSGLPSLRSIFFHPVMFAWFCAFVALYAHAAFVIFRRPWMLALGLLASVGVFLSGRRRALLALGAALAAGFGWQLRQSRPLAAIRSWAPSGVGTTVLVLVFLPALLSLAELTAQQLGPALPGAAPSPVPGQPTLPPGTAQPPGQPSVDDPLTVRQGDIARVALYRGSVAIAVDHFPLGGGLGRYGSWMSRVEYSPLYRDYGLSNIHGLRPQNPIFATDTFWPQILGETGALGLAGYMLFVLWLLVALWRAAAGAQLPFLRAFALGTLLIFVQALVESLASPMFHSPPRAFMVFIAVGAVLAVSRASPPPDRQANAAS